MPDVAYEFTEAGRQYSHTWRLKQAGRAGPSLAVDVGALRRESVSPGASPRHELLLRAGWQFEPPGGLDFSAQLDGSLIAAATAGAPSHRFGFTVRGSWPPRLGASPSPPLGASPSPALARLQR